MTSWARIATAVERALEAFAGVLLVAMLLLINTEVAARYLFNGSTLVADEYGGYLMAWITMLGAGHVLRADRHLSMTSLVDRLPPAARNAIGMAGAAIGLVVAAVLLYATATLVLSSARFGTLSIQPSKTPLVWPQLIMPLGYLLLCVAYLEEIVRRLLGQQPRRSDAVGEGLS